MDIFSGSFLYFILHFLLDGFDKFLFMLLVFFPFPYQFFPFCLLRVLHFYQNISPITRFCVNGAEVQVTLRDALALELEGMALAHLAMPRKGFAWLFVEREGENALCRRSQVTFREMEGQAAHRLPVP